MIRSVSPRAMRPRRRRMMRPLAGLGVALVVLAVGGLFWQMLAATPRNATASDKTDTARSEDASLSSPGASETPPRRTASAETPPAGAGNPPVQAASGAMDEPLEPRRVAGGIDLRPAEPAADVSRAGPDVGAEESSSAPLQTSSNPTTTVPPAVDDAANRTVTATETGNEDIAAAARLVENDRLVAGRLALMRLYDSQLTTVERNEVRALLRRVADRTIFSKQRFDDDPLTTTYTIKSGDRLAKLAPRFKVPYEIIMRINGITNAGRIRAGQKIKVPRGPFNARIDISDFRLDLYLQDTYVRSYRVALGADRGTPVGTWRVDDRLPNPTYYPPESADEKRIIPAGDPDNPLGERWIGLEGTSGDAVGQEGFGIHGTIEPETIGQAVSLGCVRMLNDEVAFVYDCLRPGASTVTTQP